MTNDDIVKLGDVREYLLRTPCLKIGNIDENGGYKAIFKEIADFVKNPENKAFALALPQLGISARGYVCRFGSEVEVFINPELSLRGHKKPATESCLSEPGVEKLVMRYQAVVVKYENLLGEKKKLRLAGLYARIVQHEQNHLDGILLSDL